MKTPMTIDLTNRERFALFVHLNALPPPNWAESRRLNAVWNMLRLDEVVEAARRGATAESAHDHEVRLPFTLEAEQRDALIDYFNKPLQGGGFVRFIVPIGEQLIAHRDAKDPPTEAAP